MSTKVEPTSAWPTAPSFDRSEPLDQIMGRIRTHRIGELTQREWDSAQGSGDFETVAAIGHWALYESGVALPSVSFERLRVATVVAESRFAIGPITSWADLASLADYIDAILPLLALDGADTTRPSGLRQSTRNAMNTLARIARRCREGAADPVAHFKQRNEAFAYTLDRWLAISHLDALESEGCNVHYERTRLGGLWNRAGRHSWVSELFSTRGTGCRAENNAHAAALRRQGDPTRALPFALTSMAQELNSYAGKTLAAVCRDALIPGFRNPRNECWVYIGQALDPWLGGSPNSIPSPLLSRARRVAAEVFDLFGLDFEACAGGVASESPALIWPTRMPAGSPSVLSRVAIA